MPRIPTLHACSRWAAGRPAKALRAQLLPRMHAWTSRPAPGVSDGSSFEVLEGATVLGRVQWSLIGEHNVDNALAALGAARHAGVPVAAGN